MYEPNVVAVCVQGQLFLSLYKATHLVKAYAEAKRIAVSIYATSVCRTFGSEIGRSRLPFFGS